MNELDIVQQRLSNQHIAEPLFEKPGDVVQWLGAVQAQDYAAAKWAVGLRLQGATDDVVEQACSDGSMLRTHVMRPTWHFVAPADIRWLLELTAPRVHAATAYWYRKAELDDALFKRCQAVIAKALEGGQQLTRLELATVLGRGGIVTEGENRMAHIMMHAELDGIICSGARQGKQFTYALLEERVPEAKTLAHDEALAEFALRYFKGHGPATLQDFVWWSGLTVAEARSGLEMVAARLISEVIEGERYWFSASARSLNSLAKVAYLLPNFDEYSVGYKDRSAIYDVSQTKKLGARGNILFSNMIVIEGRVVGIWRREVKKGSVKLAASFFSIPSQAEASALAAAANSYGIFLNMPVETIFEVVGSS